MALYNWIEIETNPKTQAQNRRIIDRIKPKIKKPKANQPLVSDLIIPYTPMQFYFEDLLGKYLIATNVLIEWFC